MWMAVLRHHTVMLSLEETMVDSHSTAYDYIHDFHADMYTVLYISSD